MLKPIRYFDKTLQKDSLSRLHYFFEQFSFYSGIVSFFVILYDLGFTHKSSTYLFFSIIYWLFISSFTIAFALRTYLSNQKSSKNIAQWLIVGLLSIFSFYKFTYLFTTPNATSWIYYGSVLISGLLIVFDISRKVLSLHSQRFNPALSFVLSFALLVFIGAGLLMLPNATVHGISFIDALFMSVSAVCVTGLATVDMAVEFTRLGKTIMLVLIQLGGLGMLSFTSFFGYLYQGGFSIDNQLFLKDLATADRLGDVFRALVRVITITLLLEIIGSMFLYATVDEAMFNSTDERFRFALFHSISAFCNAGFSTAPNGLYHEELRQNYDFQWVIAVLIILGGIGFSIITDLYHYVKYYVIQLYKWVRYEVPIKYLSRPISLHTYLVLVVTSLLLFFGMTTFWLTESEGILRDHHSWYGKLTTSFFASVTPRTAGFNTFDMGKLQPATVIIFILLMWIGASPGSTGGGIKTTTFAVALLNVLSLAKGTENIEIRRRRIPTESVRRAFAILILSLLIIGPAILIITILEPKIPLMSIAFECFSAFATAGLSLNMTPLFGDVSKLILALLMFIGRVGTFTLFVAFIRRISNNNYRYPNENIFIN